MVFDVLHAALFLVFDILHYNLTIQDERTIVLVWF